MSLNHSKYLRTLPSERRQVAIFQSGTEQQLDSIRLDISQLFEMVEKLLDLHEKEHGIIERDPITAEIITSNQPNKKARNHPYV